MAPVSRRAILAVAALIGAAPFAVAAEPGRGRVEMRPGDVVIGANWVGVTNCAGTTLPGVNVFYVPAPGFAGTDRFKLDVGYSSGRTVRAEVEVVVR